MDLLNRIMQVVRANVNGFIQQQEDPEKTLELILKQMDNDLILMRQSIAQAVATLKRNQRQLMEYETIAAQWYSRAQLAIDKQQETLARDALIRRQSYQITIKTLQEQINQEQEIINKLKKDLRHLEQKMAEAKMKKAVYIARARSAVATQKIYELTNDFQTGTGLNAFQKMEDKVRQLEAETDLITGLDKDDLEKQFSQLETNNINEIEAELTKMKTTQNLANSTTKNLTKFNNLKAKK